MKNYLIIICLMLCLASCKKKEEDAVVQTLSTNLHADSYKINVGNRNIDLVFELGDSATSDKENAMRNTALEFARAMGEPYMKKRDSVQITFIHKGNIQSHVFATQQLSAIDATLGAVNKFLDYNSTVQDMRQIVDTPVTLQHLVAISNMLQSFKAPEAKDNKQKLTKVDFSTSLINNEPATVIWVDVENKTEVMHFQFVVSTERKKIIYVGINDAES